MRLGQILLEEPVLDRGERHLARHRSLFGFDRRCGTGDLRQAGNRLMLEHLPRGEPQAGLIGARHNLDGQDRVATEREEIVVHSYAVELQHVAPDCRQDLFGGRAWPDKGAELRAFFRSWQILSIKLAIGGYRVSSLPYE